VPGDTATVLMIYFDVIPLGCIDVLLKPQCRVTDRPVSLGNILSQWVRSTSAKTKGLD